jgi:hypothetical protein
MAALLVHYDSVAFGERVLTQMPTVSHAVEASDKVLIAPRSTSGTAVGPAIAHGGKLPPRISIDPDTVEDGLVRLVLCLVDTLRQLLERQAIRRVDGGKLAEDEIERLGLTLLRLEERMAQLKASFGLKDEDLTLKLESVHGLSDLVDEERQAPR